MIVRMVGTFGTEHTSYILIILAQILIPVSFIFVNENRFNPIETTLVRGLTLVLLNLLGLRYYGMTADFKPDFEFRHLLYRSGVFTLHGIALTVIQFYIPQQIVHTINSSLPIFILVWDYSLHGVRVSRAQLVALGFGVCGIIVTINSELIRSLIAIQSPDELAGNLIGYIKVDGLESAIACLVFVVFLGVYAHAILQVRVLTRMVHFEINLHFGLVMTFVAGLLYPFRVVKPVSPSRFFLSFVLAGVPSALAATCMTPAIKMNKNTGMLNTLVFTSVIVSFLINYTRYGRLPNTIELVGVLLIIIGVIGAIKCKPPEASPPST